jgi:metal-responsive CopG/Arc/MetJ family transcriptional regulator
MPPADEYLEVDVRFDEELLDDVDRYRRRSAHENRSAVVSVAIDRLVDDDHSP